MRNYVSVARQGDRILHRYVEDGRDMVVTEDYCPTLFMTDSAVRSAIHHDMKGNPVTPVTYSSIRDMSDACEKYKGMGILFGQDDVILQFISERYPGKIEHDIRQLRTCIVDIETDSRGGYGNVFTTKKAITSIAMYDSLDNAYLVWSLPGWDPSKSEIVAKYGVTVIHFHFDQEYDLLKSFLERWKSHYPAIISGWFSDGYDIPYIHGRLGVVLGEERVQELSPFGRVWSKEGTDKYDNPTKEVTIVGVPALDYMALYRKFTFKARESYKIGHIAYVELGEEKLDYSAEGDLAALLEKNPQKYVDYNVKDVLLVHRLNAKLLIFQMALNMAYSAKVNFEDVFSPTKVWDSFTYNDLISRNVVPEVRKGAEKKVKYDGGYVKEPVPGASRWILSFDVASLYPSIIRQWNMCPSTIAGQKSLPYDDYKWKVLARDPEIRDHAAASGSSIAVNGVAFDNAEQGVFPRMVELMYNERVAAKKKMFGHKTTKEAIATELISRGVTKEEIDNLLGD